MCIRTFGAQESKFLKFLGFMWNPLSWVMEAAALMAIVLANGQVSVWVKKARRLTTCSIFGPLYGDEVLCGDHLWMRGL